MEGMLAMDDRLMEKVGWWKEYMLFIMDNEVSASGTIG